MNPLHNQIYTFFTKYQAVAPGDTLLVAVSGGADSLCLLHALVALRESLGLTLHVAHLDHMLRGAASAADAAFVRATAEGWDVPISVESIDVAAYAAAERLNLHDAARRVRYAFLARCADALDAHAVATAHHANDQAETVLLHLLRGAGTAGLAAMRPRATLQGHSSLALVRPLLATTRAEIEAYCHAHGLAPRSDSTNTDHAYTRNRIRHELLPLLLSYNPRIVEALGRTASANADDSAFIQQSLDAVWHELATVRANGVTLDGAAWQAVHPALQRAALRRAYATLGGTATLGWEHIEQARTLAAGPVGGQLPLPGGIVLEIGYNGNMTLGEPANTGPQLIVDQEIGEQPFTVALTDGWMLHVGGVPSGRDRWSIALDWAALAPPLVVRGRQPGDRLRPAGGRGSRSIQNIFVDAKVPRELRDRWPLLADRRQIVWVAGLRAAEGCVATTKTTTSVSIQVVPGVNGVNMDDRP